MKAQNLGTFQAGIQCRLQVLICKILVIILHQRLQMEGRLDCGAASLNSGGCRARKWSSGIRSANNIQHRKAEIMGGALKRKVIACFAIEPASYNTPP